MGRRVNAGLAAGLGAICLCALAGCERGGVAAEPRYLLWRVDGATHDVYLLGSVHVLRPGDHVVAPAVEHAYAAASELVMELDFDDFDAAALGELMAHAATDAGGLVESLGPEAYARAAARAARIGLDLEPLRATEPWFAAIGVTDLALSRLGFDAEHGVEAEFTGRARADGKKISGLETPEFQVALLDALPADQQRALFLKAIEEAEDLPELIDELLGAWRRGDDGALREDLTTTFEPFPDLYRMLIVDRNERWLPQILLLLQEPRDTLVIVGALHLIGEHSVINLLEQRGYTAQRL